MSDKKPYLGIRNVYKTVRITRVDDRGVTVDTEAPVPLCQSKPRFPVFYGGFMWIVAPTPEGTR